VKIPSHHVKVPREREDNLKNVIYIELSILLGNRLTFRNEYHVCNSLSLRNKVRVDKRAESFI